MYSFSFPYQTAEWVYSVWNIAFCPKMTWFFRKNRFFFDFLYIWNQFELLIPKMDDNLGPSGSNRLSHTQTSHIAGSRQQSYSFFRLFAYYLWKFMPSRLRQHLSWPWRHKFSQIQYEEAERNSISWAQFQLKKFVSLGNGGISLQNLFYRYVYWREKETDFFLFGCTHIRSSIIHINKFYSCLRAAS